MNQEHYPGFMVLLRRNEQVAKHDAVLAAAEKLKATGADQDLVDQVINRALNDVKSPVVKVAVKYVTRCLIAKAKERALAEPPKTIWGKIGRILLGLLPG